MQRLAAWVVGAIAGVGVARLLLRRRREPLALPSEVPADDRAEELRRKLDESRALVEEREAFEDGELTVDQAEPPPPEPEERRRQVHDRARRTAARMRREPSD